ncbi:TPA: hypothetical protein U2M28_001342 [Providencia stuartii]|uniref:hypothetical protein n=3 Tax=Providencia stuartii TaxID=588 RepID=UPI000909D55F|nr:hypothetical protein [Providencia stuartii]APG52514.1 hypothetical protein BGK56_16820 [Providencia stuartii]AVL41251.1 hypothetical protein CEP70_15295 [Providencia stuartii]MBG5904546.1 hypothetical protein [Providencia stuartii]MBG5912179.1 hypothetical protein [Providencia stuartii]MBG5916139.1 hypothetical protein [Providencia stuartii]
MADFLHNINIASADFWNTLWPYIRIITIFGACFAIYFAWQKLFYKLAVSPIISGNLYTDTQISDVYISNKKDRTVVIWSINIVIDNDLSFNIFKPKSPIILKGFESIKIEIDKYSYLLVDGEKIKIDYINSNIDFYINVGDKIIKGMIEKKANFTELKYRNIMKVNVNHKGHIYNESVKYMLEYNFNGHEKIAFFGNDGYIGNEWGFSPNHMGKFDYDENDIKNLLVNYGFDNHFSNYRCTKVNHSEHKLTEVFRKTIP